MTEGKGSIPKKREMFAASVMAWAALPDLFPAKQAQVQKNRLPWPLESELPRIVKPSSPNRSAQPQKPKGRHIEINQICQRKQQKRLLVRDEVGPEKTVKVTQGGD